MGPRLLLTASVMALLSSACGDVDDALLQGSEVMSQPRDVPDTWSGDLGQGPDGAMADTAAPDVPAGETADAGLDADGDAVSADIPDGDATEQDGLTDADTAAATDGQATIPTEAAALLEWLKDGEYGDWPATSIGGSEGGSHLGFVRVLVTPELEASLAAGNFEHPVGSAAVLERYGDAPIEVISWAVAVKVAGPGLLGQGWRWFEGDHDQLADQGIGAPLCTACHAAGSDYVRTRTPLR